MTEILKLGGRTLEAGVQLMGVVNASSDSFSDAGDFPDLESQFLRATQLIEDGASFIDIGGESARTDRPARIAEEEIELVCPLIERIATEHDCVISIDTYKPAVAAAAVKAGAHLINDISGLRDLELARIAAETGAGLVLMHNEGVPKVALLEQNRYADVAATVKQFLSQKIGVATAAGVPREQLIVDPGPDFSKTPFQTIELLQSLDGLAELGRPILLAASRKDFIGALTDRAPDRRAAGTLAALEFGAAHGAQIFRVHDVAAAREFFRVRQALS